jgi:hypothetical protein
VSQDRDLGAPRVGIATGAETTVRPRSEDAPVYLRGSVATV